MKKILALVLLFYALNSEELNKSGFILGIEASFGFPITYDGSLTILHTSSIMGGIYTGYQHYFDENFGIKILFGIHDATPVIAQFEQNITISAIPLWIGGRVDLLWDFWESPLHSVGIKTGIEYAFESYRSREAKIDQTKQSLSSITQHNLYPLIGFYYRYKKMEFSLDYRFFGALKPKLQNETINNKDFNTKYKFNESLNLTYSYRF